MKCPPDGRDVSETHFSQCPPDCPELSLKLRLKSHHLLAHNITLSHFSFIARLRPPPLLSPASQPFVFSLCATLGSPGSSDVTRARYANLPSARTARVLSTARVLGTATSRQLQSARLAQSSRSEPSRVELSRSEARFAEEPVTGLPAVGRAVGLLLGAAGPVLVRSEWAQSGLKVDSESATNGLRVG